MCIDVYDVINMKLVSIRFVFSNRFTLKHPFEFRLDFVLPIKIVNTINKIMVLTNGYRNKKKSKIKDG